MSANFIVIAITSLVHNWYGLALQFHSVWIGL